MRSEWQVLFDQTWPAVLGLGSRSLLQPLFGTKHVSISQWLLEYDQSSESQQEAWRQERLAEVLQAATSHVPFYRGYSPDPVDLEKFPVVDKALIREDTTQFLSTAPDRGRTVTKRTSGSTGDPWIYQLDRRAFSHMYGAQLAAFRRFGYRYGQRRIYLGSPISLGLGTLNRTRAVRLLLERNNPSLAGFDISRPHSIVRAIRAADQSAGLWYGYASSITAMAHAVIDHDLPITGPPLIVTMAEKLEPSWRSAIELAFPDTAVIEEYGCNDGGVLAHSCPAGRMHLADSISIVEVLNGDRPCSVGEEGDVTITNLHAQAMPFIRYQIGDRAVVGPTSCECGRPGPTLESITGRSGDQVELLDGRLLTRGAFAQVFKTSTHVRRWQVIQWSIDKLEVRIDAGPTFDDVELARLHCYLDELIGEAGEITVETSEPLLQTQAGKHRVILVEPSLTDAPTNERSINE